MDNVTALEAARRMRRFINNIIEKYEAGCAANEDREAGRIAANVARSIGRLVAEIPESVVITEDCSTPVVDGEDGARK